MLKLYMILAVVLASANSFAQGTGAELLKKMHTRYKHGICKAYSFSQKNTHYRNDTVIRTSDWHEQVEFPDRFQIVFGDKTKGHSVLFRNDSVYSYRKFELVSAAADSNTLLLLLGGMYYRELDDVAARLKAAAYDLSKVAEQKWNEKQVFILGGTKGNLESNQIWVDATTLNIVRIIEKMNATDWMDMRFESHVKWCNGYVENKVSFRRNGKLEQVEEYYDLKELK